MQICDWIKKDGNRCTREAKETFSLCWQHLEEQKKLQQQAFQNAKYIEASPKPAGEDVPVIETTGLNQLEQATKERGEGALTIFGGDPERFPKFSRKKDTCIARNEALGYRIVGGATPESSSRPVVGQSENTVRNHGMTYKNQVDKNGHIVVGDLILMDMPRSKRLAQIKASEQKSAQRVRGVIRGSTSQRPVNGAKHKMMDVPGYIQKPQDIRPLTTKKSYFVPAQIG